MEILWTDYIMQFFLYTGFIQKLLKLRWYLPRQIKQKEQSEWNIHFL